jgi:hypothetical protein
MIAFLVIGPLAISSGVIRLRKGDFQLNLPGASPAQVAMMKRWLPWAHIGAGVLMMATAVWHLLFSN